MINSLVDIVYESKAKVMMVLGMSHQFLVLESGKLTVKSVLQEYVSFSCIP